jgi:nucleoside-diphosphate-sugar epimerase
MARVMVTGGSGFIGTNVVESLCRDGHEVLNIDIAPPRCSAHAEYHHQADIRDKGAMARAIDEFSPAQIVHLAAEACVFGTSLEFFDANTTGVRNLVELLRERPAVERCIFASTKLVFPNGYKPKHINDYCPDTLYGRSKVIGEQIVHEAGDSLPCTWCIVRPTSIWGPWFESGYLMFVRSVARGRYWHLGKADPPRSFGYVGNVVYQLRALLEAPPESVGGKTFYLSDYEQYTIRQWANYIARIEGRREPRTLPDWFVGFSARIGDVLQKLGWRDVPLTTFRLRNMRMDTAHIDLEPVRQIVGPVPFDLESGMAETLVWMREHGHLE